MTTTRFTLTLCALIICAFALTSTVQAQAPQRTFVSTQGNDANTSAICSRTAPCRNFAAAISIVASGGEVVALDSGGYGAVTITKAVQIISPSGVYAGITVLSGDGITVNAPNETVVLRGLPINRQGTGANGIIVQAVGALHVEGCTISGFSDDGIEFSVAGKLFVKDSIIRSNKRGILIGTVSGSIEASLDHLRLEGNGQDGLRVTENAQVAIRDSVAADNGTSGIQFSLGISGAPASLHVENCLLTNNNGHGIYIITNTNLTIDVSIANSAVVNNGGTGIYLSGGSSAGIIATIEDSRIINNGDYGIAAGSNAGVVVRVSNTTITRNGIGIIATSGATIRSFGDNKLVGNRDSDGAFAAPIITKQ